MLSDRVPNVAFDNVTLDRGSGRSITLGLRARGRRARGWEAVYSQRKPDYTESCTTKEQHKWSHGGSVKGMRMQWQAERQSLSLPYLSPVKSRRSCPALSPPAQVGLSLSDPLRLLSVATPLAASVNFIFSHASLSNSSFTYHFPTPARITPTNSDLALRMVFTEPTPRIFEVRLLCQLCGGGDGCYDDISTQLMKPSHAYRLKQTLLIPHG